MSAAARAHDFEAYIQSLGLMPRGVADDGKWRRCGTQDKPRSKNGAYKLLPGATLGFVQDWSAMDSPVQWRPELSPEDQENIDWSAVKKRWSEQRRRQEEHEHRAITRARDLYLGYRRLEGPHPYLEAKGLGVEGCHQLRLSGKGWLVVPATHPDRGMLSFQAIRDDGRKLFFKDAPIRGTSFEISRRRWSVTVLVEGLATGLAIFQTVPDSRVIVCWNTGNLVTVAERAKIKGLAVVAADNDHETEARGKGNPGIEAGRAAAAEIGAGVAIPEGLRGTDWADLLGERIRSEINEIRDPYRTPYDVEREVKARIRRQIMREARFVTT